jgi:hypothetical protein
MECIESSQVVVTKENGETIAKSSLTFWSFRAFQARRLAGSLSSATPNAFFGRDKQEAWRSGFFACASLNPFQILNIMDLFN